MRLVHEQFDYVKTAQHDLVVDWAVDMYTKTNKISQKILPQKMIL